MRTGSLPSRFATTRFFVTRSITQNTTATANTTATRRFGSGLAGVSGSGVSTGSAWSTSGSGGEDSVLTRSILHGAAQPPPGRPQQRHEGARERDRRPAAPPARRARARPTDGANRSGGAEGHLLLSGRTGAVRADPRPGPSGRPPSRTPTAPRARRSGAAPAG